MKVRSYEHGDGVIKVTKESGKLRYYVGIYNVRYGPFEEEIVAQAKIGCEMLDRRRIIK